MYDSLGDYYFFFVGVITIQKVSWKLVQHVFEVGMFSWDPGVAL